MVQQKSDLDKREHVSFRLALIVTTLLALAMLWVISEAIFDVGVVKSALLIALILAAGVVIRVVLTGKWSETSWVGKVLDKIPGLSAKPDAAPQDEN